MDFGSVGKKIDVGWPAMDLELISQVGPLVDVDANGNHQVSHGLEHSLIAKGTLFEGTAGWAVIAIEMDQDGSSALLGDSAGFFEAWSPRDVVPGCE